MADNQQIDSMISSGMSNSQIRQALGDVKKHLLASRRIIYRRQHGIYFSRRNRYGDLTADPPAKLKAGLPPPPRRCQKCDGYITTDIIWSPCGAVMGWRCVNCGITAESYCIKNLRLPQSSV